MDRLLTNGDQGALEGKRARHGRDRTPLGERVYREIMEHTVKKDSPRLARASTAARKFMRGVDPRDPLEQVLAEQILWMHGTMAHLSHFAVTQNNLRAVEMLHRSRDRLATACRRHVMALQEYRKPRQKSFTAVRQANIAGQQIVANAGVGEVGIRKLDEGVKYARIDRIESGAGKTTAEIERRGEREAKAADSGDSAVGI